MSDVAFRPRSVSEILDATIQLFKSNFGPIVMTAAIVIAPLALIQLLLINLFPGYSPAGSLTTQQAASNQLSGALFYALASWVAYALMGGVVVRAASDAYRGGVIDPLAAYRDVTPRTLTLMGAAFLKSLAIALPMFAVGIVASLAVGIGMAMGKGAGPAGAIIAGVVVLAAVVFGFAGFFYMLGRYVAVDPAVVLEGRSATQSLSRSSELTKGTVWHAARALALGGVIMLVLYIGVVMVATMLPGVMQVLLLQALGAIFFPAYFVLEMMLYYDCRVRTGAFDLELGVNSLGAPPAPAAPVSTL